MTDFVTSSHIARRTAAAVDAAVGAGRELGLTVTDATVLHELFSVAVQLAPAPAAVRVPGVRPQAPDPAEQRRSRHAEAEDAQWLAGRGQPAARPRRTV